MMKKKEYRPVWWQKSGMAYIVFDYQEFCSLCFVFIIIGTNYLYGLDGKTQFYFLFCLPPCIYI
ncbi:hypothetical protein [Bacteroides sp. AN502(2024)]|uniref:hypothetical protein n=1 Tax=Bacteroides sp. AN502(2024) TaxID=3160599 RepID=UPI003517A5F0